MTVWEVTIVCDTCNVVGPTGRASTPREALTARDRKAIDWATFGPDLCPACRLPRLRAAGIIPLGEVKRGAA